VAGGRPKKKSADRGMKKYIIVYEKQLTELEDLKNNIRDNIKTNDSELIRVAISLLEHFENDFISECIIEQRIQTSANS
jgi:hypothetical protein